MAEIQNPQKGSRRKIQAPRIDFTPMVDLGFILITFFIYTTTMAQPNTMQVNMPSDEHTDSPTQFIEESTITLIPVKGHNVVHYNGALKSADQLQMHGIGKMLDILIARKKAVAELPPSFSGEAHKLHVLIKPGDDSRYADLVELLDDMSIVDVPYYAIVDVSSEEKEWIAGFTK